MERPKFSEVLHKVHIFAKSLGLQVIDSSKLDSYYKGDLDGLHIWTDSRLDDEEELFNVLHMIGHCIQWGVDKELRELGSVLHKNPDSILLIKLQRYEWEANCYALSILHSVGVRDLDDWLFMKYKQDMYYLTHFYKTGERVKEVTNIALQYAFTASLAEKPIPTFNPIPIIGTRDGLVINFDKQT